MRLDGEGRASVTMDPDRVEVDSGLTVSRLHRYLGWPNWIAEYVREIIL